MTPTESFRRTVPESWGEWPPSQARLDEAAARAMAAAKRIAEELAPDDDPVIELWLDLPETHAMTWFASSSETRVIGAILIPALGRGWMIVWEPATGAGHLWEHRARFPHEQERLRNRGSGVRSE